MRRWMNSERKLLNMPSPSLTLVGAGPGDPELITIKGIRALEAADVVLYDALIDRSLLKYAPNAEKIFVGKRSGLRAFSQDEINELIVSKALTTGHVVRLKGGDPFVFGRGSEEIEFALKHGMEVKVIPGITSCTAVPGSLGISVTQRQVAQSFWVITGMTSDHQLAEEMRIAAQTSATVVVLMGFGKLAEIVSIYQNQGKNDQPIAVIQNGTLPNERAASGTMETILYEVRDKNLGTPAIIVIGEVVRHSKMLDNFLTESALNSDYLKTA